MAKSPPPLTWLRAFEAAARHLSFTAAADEIGLTQSAVSQQIKALEHRLRVPLFVRQARGLALTDHGRRLLPEIGKPLEALAAATARFDAGPAANLLTVATSVSIAQWVIAPNLPHFTAQNPDIRIRLLSAIWPDDFHSARADVEIRFGSAKQAGRDAHRLSPDDLIAVKATGLPGDINDLPVIETVGTSGGWQAWSDEFGVTASPALYADTYGMALHLAVHGNGVALVSALLAQHAIAAGSVVQVTAGSLPAQEGYFISGDFTQPAAQRFRDWLLQLVSAP